jgi:iron(III) transport system substrate-binding protein
MSESQKRAVVSRRRFLEGAGAGVGALALTGALSGGSRAKDTFVWYSGNAVEPTDELSKLFTSRTGIPVEYFRAGSNNLAQKFEQEVKANQVRASAIQITNPTLAARWAKEGLILPYNSPEFANYPASFVIQGFAGPATGEPHLIAYNKELVRAEDAPKHWVDILDPKWKGKLVMTDGASSASALHWFAALKSVYGDDFMKKLAAQNVLIKTGGADVANSLVAGERQVAIMITQGHASRAIAAKGPLRIVMPDEGAPLLSSVIFVPTKAPDPTVGKQFVDFVLGEEAQSIMANKHYVSSLRKGLPPLSLDTGARPLSEMKAMASGPEDLDKYLANQEALAQEYTELFK